MRFIFNRLALFIITAFFPLMVFSKPALNLPKFHACQKIIRTCPLLGPFRNQECVKNKLNRHLVCNQLAALSVKTSVSANLISARQYGNLIILSFYYPADGQFLYSILQPSGHIINMNQGENAITQFIKKIQKKHHYSSLLAVSISKPYYHHKTISLRLRITPCMACQTIGYATAFYYFNSHDAYIGMRIHSYFLKHIQK